MFPRQVLVIESEPKEVSVCSDMQRTIWQCLFSAEYQTASLLQERRPSTWPGVNTWKGIYWEADNK